MAIKLFYLYEEYKDCPEATEISHSRARAKMIYSIICVSLFLISLPLAFVDSSDRWMAICGLVYCPIWFVYLLKFYDEKTNRLIKQALMDTQKGKFEELINPYSTQSNTKSLVKHIIIGTVVLSLVVVCIVNIIINQNEKNKYNGILRNFSTDKMDEDFTNVYANVISINPKHYVYNNYGDRTTEDNLTEIVCECETVEGKTVWISFFYWECPAYSSYQKDRLVEYTVENPLKVTGYIQKSSEVADDLNEEIGDVFVLFSQESQINE